MAYRKTGYYLLFVTLTALMVESVNTLVKHVL